MDTRELIAKTREYLNYIEDHINNVDRALEILLSRLAEDENKIKELPEDLQEVFKPGRLLEKLKSNLKSHDASKLSEKEFIQYRKNFFPVSESERIRNTDAFELAKNAHVNGNLHHTQARHSVFYRSRLNEEEHILNVIETILDWAAMTLYFGRETSYREFYDENKTIYSVPERDYYIFEGIYKILGGVRDGDRLQ